MKDGKKIKYNLLVGMFGQAAALILGIIVPRLTLRNYGSEINGLLTSVTNIYAYIAIVEAGITAASCQALYRPIAEKNYNQANSVLAATNIYYQKTGRMYLGAIAVFAALYPALIRTGIPYKTTVLVILFNGLGNVINFFFHGKYLILLKADGRNYVRAGMEVFTNAAKQLLKILLIAQGFDVVHVQFAAMLVSFAQMVYISWYIKKNYLWIDMTCEPDMQSVSHRKNVLIHEINYLITSNVDVVLLTVFKSLKMVSVYSLYALLFGTLNKVLHVIKETFEFKIAYYYHKNWEKFLDVFESYEVYYTAFSFALYTIAHFFILPFMKLYTAGITDVEYIHTLYPILFVLVGLLSTGRYPSAAMIHISGHFKQTQNSATIESAINILVSVILIHRFGIIGVLIGTVVSSCYRTVYLIGYVNKNIIKRKSLNSYKCWLASFCVYLVVMYVNQFIHWRLDSYGRILMYCVPYAMAVVALYILVISLCHRKAFNCLLGCLKKRENKPNPQGNEGR